MDSHTGRPDELRVMDALQVVSEIINDAVAALKAAKVDGEPHQAKQSDARA